MADLAHVVGQDLQLSASGDLALVTTSDETQQRVLHRLLTSLQSYIWQPAYGAGLSALLGSPAAAQQIAALIRVQLRNENGVAQSPEPVVTVRAGVNGVITASITYRDVGTNSMEVLTLATGG